MAVSNSDVSLPPEKLNDLDRLILDYLASDGRATPKLLQLELRDRGHEPGVRQNINQRLSRLAEHEYIDNLHGTGVCEFVNDPREE